jgi:hypothetical protein
MIHNTRRSAPTHVVCPNAVTTQNGELMYSTPAVAFGAIAVWWFAQGKKDE